MLSSNNMSTEDLLSPLKSRRLSPLPPQDAMKIISKSPCNSHLKKNTITNKYKKGLGHNCCPSVRTQTSEKITRVVFDRNPFYKKVNPQPCINKKVRYKHILTEIGELPKYFEGNKVYDSCSKRDRVIVAANEDEESSSSSLLMGLFNKRGRSSTGIEVPLTLNEIYVEENDQH